MYVLSEELARIAMRLLTILRYSRENKEEVAEALQDLVNDMEENKNSFGQTETENARAYTVIGALMTQMIMDMYSVTPEEEADTWKRLAAIMIAARKEAGPILIELKKSNVN